MERRKLGFVRVRRDYKKSWFCEGDKTELRVNLIVKEDSLDCYSNK